MIDNITTRQRSTQRQPMVNYRPDEMGVYARRVMRVSDEGRSRQELSKLKSIPAGVNHVVPESNYRAHNIDEVLVKITQIEAEGGTVGQPSASSAVGVAFINKDIFTSVSTQMYEGLRHIKLPSKVVLGGAVAAIVLAFTGYISLDTWMTNNQVRQIASDRQVAGDSTVRAMAILGEGEDEAEVTDSAVDSYAVAPDLPRVLTIDKIGVEARVLPMSVNSDGSVQAPVNIFDSGWYGASAKPGQAGAGFIDAHASGATRQGLFAYLDTLVVGDTVSVERGDGQLFNYRVAHVETVNLDKVDMKKALRTHGGATEGLNLMTCTGEWLPEEKTYDQRAIVYTVRV